MWENGYTRYLLIKTLCEFQSFNKPPAECKTELENFLHTNAVGTSLSPRKIHTHTSMLITTMYEKQSSRKTKTRGRLHHFLTDTTPPCGAHSSGAVWKSRWPSWAVRPNEPYGFRGRKATLNHASALVSTCP